MEQIILPVDQVMQQMVVNSPLRDRKIYLNEEISRESIFKILYWLERIESIDERQGTKEPIEIVLDTYGGTVFHTLSLCSKIKSMITNGYEIITTVRSTAFSGGCWILMCGSKRRAYTNARILLHNIISTSDGCHQDILDDVAEIEALWDRLKQIVIENTNITNEKLEEIKKYKFDWYCWSEQALEYNIIDEVI